MSISFVFGASMPDTVCHRHATLRRPYRTVLFQDTHFPA